MACDVSVTQRKSYYYEYVCTWSLHGSTCLWRTYVQMCNGSALIVGLVILFVGSVL